MTVFKTRAASPALLILPLSALTGDKETVPLFYAFPSNPASETQAQAFDGAITNAWVSIGDYSGKTNSGDALIGQMRGFAQVVRDLNLAVEEMIAARGRVSVRDRVTGAPRGPLFGVDGEGKSFEVVSIDVHALEKGKITRSYHVKDWVGALPHLSAAKPRIKSPGAGGDGTGANDLA